MSLSVVDNKIYLSFLILLSCLCENVFPKNPYKSGEVRIDYPKGCAYLRCKRGNECVNRMFWCKNPPCPSMLYCSKSQKEFMKGPSSCEAVRCSRGYVCLVRVRHCRWGEECEQQIARCVSERDYKEGPESCADFQCPSGLRCILRESSCAKPPCKLRKACANTKDVKIWLERCKTLGCLSEHECFLRKPENDCAKPPCKYTPDCSAKNEEELETRELCRGWVCPKEHECTAYTKGPCKHDSCNVSRSCHKPLIIPIDTTPSPQHSWRDDIKLSFYSKKENNVTNSRKNRFVPRHATNKNPSGNVATLNKKNSTNLANANFNPNGKVPVHVSSNSRPSTSRPLSARPDMISGRVGKPAVTSLTTWLNHLKLMTGVDAIEVWIKRADRQEGYGEFLEWLDSVEDMLGPAAYDLWLEEVRAMTVTSEAFQNWLPPSRTNRTMVSHDLVETDGKPAGGSDERPGISTDSLVNRKYRKNEDTNNVQPETINEEEGMRNNDFEPENHVSQPENDTLKNSPIIPGENSILHQPGIRSIQPRMGINEWSQLYPPHPRNFPQGYPFKQNVRAIIPWGSQAIPYQGFDNTGLINSPYQEYQSNWSFQQPSDNNGDFLRSNAWQGQLFPPLYPQWQLARDPRDNIFPDRRILHSTQIRPEYFSQLTEFPLKFHSQNSTFKYVMNPYDTSRLVGPENFGPYPTDNRNFGYPNWPSSSYEGQSLLDAQHRRFKHEDSSSDSGRSRWNDGTEQRSEEKLSDPNEDWSLYHSGFPWNFMDSTLHEHNSHILNYNKRNLYDINDQDRSAILPSLPRTHRVDSDPRLSLVNPYVPDNERQVYRPDYRWTNFHPHDRPYRIPETHSPLRPIQIDPLHELKPPKVDDEGTRKFVFGEKVNDVPGQSMGLPDLWNSRYRNPFSLIFRKSPKEEIGNLDTMMMNRPTSTTKSPPLEPTTRRIAPSQILPIPQENFHLESDHYEDDGKRFDDYSAEEDDGIYPLLLRLQGYIESSPRQDFQDSANPQKNSSILPVYTIESDVRTDDDYDEDYETIDENSAIPEQEINFFQNEKYGGSPDFPDNLKSIFDFEAALILQNQTGNGNIEIKDMQWEYEDNEDPSTVEDSSNFWDQSQSYIPLTVESLNNDGTRGWFGNVSETWNEKRPETAYYEERVDYSDGVHSRDRSNSNLEHIDDDDSLNHEDTPDILNDRFYDDPEHKTFKKNHPL